MIKELAEEFKNNLLVQEKILKNTSLLQFQQKKKLQELIKMDKKLQKIYVTYYNLRIAQDLWQDHHQILSIIFLKEFRELNENMDMLIKKCETFRIKSNYCDYFLKCTNFEDDLIE